MQMRSKAGANPTPEEERQRAPMHHEPAGSSASVRRMSAQRLDQQRRAHGVSSTHLLAHLER
ncbi:MAG: hypothetical protein AAFS10_04160, partial [Myxococcota bacterium]